MQRKDNESYLSYLRRITEACADKRITYVEWGDCVLGEDNTYSSDNLRKAFYVVSKMINKIDVDTTDDSVMEELEALKDEVKKERIKLQTVNIEKNRNDRQDARQELFYEQVGQYVKSYVPPKIKFECGENKSKKKYILTIADIHDGIEFVSSNNEYSPKIVEDRFAILLEETIKFVKEKNLSELTVLGLGDWVQGVLRTNDLRANDTTVVKSCVHVCDLISDFLNELSAYVKVNYYDVEMANHSQIRYLGTKANAMMDEDLGYFMAHYIKTALRFNDRIVVYLPKENDLFLEVNDIFNFNIIACHGHQVKNLNTIVSDLSMQRHKFYDVAIVGHFHSGKETVVNESYGNNVEVLTANSFVGSDPYSDSLCVGAKAGCNIYGFEETYGHTETYKIILN